MNTRSGRDLARLREEVQNLDVRMWLGLSCARLLPPLVGIRLRTLLIRMAGLRVGPGTTFGGALQVHGAGTAAARISIGSQCWINAGCTLDASAPITVGDRVAIGQDVMILTNTHELGPHEWRAGAVEAHPVVIGDGTWIGARSLVLPGVTIGRGVIVAAGSVVNRSVPDDTMVAGVPAREVRRLEP